MNYAKSDELFAELAQDASKRARHLKFLMGKRTFITWVALVFMVLATGLFIGSFVLGINELMVGGAICLLAIVVAAIGAADTDGLIKALLLCGGIDEQL